MPPAFGILIQPIRIDMLLQLPLESLGIKSKSGSILQQVLIVEHVLMLEQHPVHLPKLVLDGSCLRRFRGMPGMRMNMSQWKMAKDKA